MRVRKLVVLLFLFSAASLSAATNRSTNDRGISLLGAAFTNAGGVVRLIDKKIHPGDSRKKVQRFIESEGWVRSIFFDGTNRKLADYNVIVVRLYIDTFIWSAAWYRVIFYFDEKQNLQHHSDVFGRPPGFSIPHLVLVNEQINIASLDKPVDESSRMFVREYLVVIDDLKSPDMSIWFFKISCHQLILVEKDVLIYIHLS